LSEQDLNRLDYYIKAKNRLHNRYLFGSGVVCGLDVRCNPCGDVVTVTPGYALSPCGDDIVVCKTDTVDICSLIAQCRATTGPDCRPFAGDQTDCADIEPWILAIRYEEKPARGITALTGGPSSGCCACGKTDCSCKGAQSNCGCGASAANPANGPAQPAGARTATRTPRNAPPACEPTLTCEGYRYDVFRAPTEGERNLGGGELVQRILGCVLDLFNQFQNLPSALQPDPVWNSRVAWSQWCCNVKQALTNHFATYGGYDCEAVYELQAIICPPPTLERQAFLDALGIAFIELVVTAARSFLSCICSAALPPCHDAGDPRVPLALVNVRRSDCTIVSVCDWTPLRRHVITFVTLRYWLGWLPFGQALRAFMESLCCNTLGLGSLVGGRWTPQAMDVRTGAAATTATTNTGAAAAIGGGGGGQDAFSQPLTFDVGNAGRPGLGTNVMQAIIHNLASPAPTLTVGDLGQALFQPLDPPVRAPKGWRRNRRSRSSRKSSGL